MSFRTLHLHLMTYPTQTADSVIDYAIGLAQAFEARIDATIACPDVRLPTSFLAARILSSIEGDIENASLKAADALEARLQGAASRNGVAYSATKVPFGVPSTGEDNVWRGRTTDLAILGRCGEEIDERLTIEEWVFKTGRPVIVCPATAPGAFRCDTVLVAWDYSRAASRALADSLPLLKRAQNVRLTSFKGEKALPAYGGPAPVLDYLAHHGIAAHFDEVDVGGKRIGAALIDQADKIGADLVVMGAFGHSRTREFLLGGATMALLTKSARPVLLSH
jgi:nucleotide-binding universal stress UspA family protein